MFLTWRPDTIRLLKSDRDFSLHTFPVFVHKIGNIEHFVPTRIAVFPGLYKISRKTTGKIEHFRAQKKRAPFPIPAFPRSYLTLLPQFIRTITLLFPYIWVPLFCRFVVNHSIETAPNLPLKIRGFPARRCRFPT